MSFPVRKTGRPSNPVLFHLVLVLNLLAVWGVAWIMLYQRIDGYKRFPLDAYYYLDMARNFASTGMPIVRFEQGVPIHFFPGYSMFLGLCTLGHVDPGWFGLQCFLIAADSALLVLVVRAFGFSTGVALGAGCLLTANCVFLKWAGVPYAELSAVFWILTSVLTFRWAAGRGGWRLIVPGTLAGFAIVTRLDTAYVVPVLGMLLVVQRNWRPTCEAGVNETSGRVRARHDTGSLVVFLLAAAAVPFLYFVLKKLHSGNALPYVDELVTEQNSSHPAEIFLNSFPRMFRQINTMHPEMWVNFGVIIMHWFFLAVWVISLRGFAGRGMRAVSWVIFAYLTAHSFWHYDTERFNLPILPASIFVFVAGVEWMITKGRVIDGASCPGKCLFAVTILICSGLQILYATATIGEHQVALSQDAGKPAMLASVANRKPGEAWIDADPQFAYHYQGHVYFDRDEPYFYRRTVKDAGAYFRSHNIQWVVSRETPAKWFADHPGVSSGTLSLKMKASDGLFNLYEVLPADQSSIDRRI